jgi:hypothetical protein
MADAQSAQSASVSPCSMYIVMSKAVIYQFDLMTTFVNWL